MSGTVVAGQKLTSALLGDPAWTAMTLLNSWSNIGEVDAQFRVWELTNELEVIGRISHASISGGGTSQIATMTSLPASLQRRALQEWSATNVFASATGTPHLELTTGGSLTLVALQPGTTSLSFHAFYSLDA